MESAKNVDTENQRPPATAYTPALDRLLRRAAWIRDAETALASFTPVFLAFFASDDELSRWVQDKASWVGPDLLEVIGHWNAARPAAVHRDMARIALAAQRTELDLAGQPLAISPSVERIVATAAALRDRVKPDVELDVRHVWAAYLYGPHAESERARLDGWKLDREAWATRFRADIAASWPDEAAGWRAVHDQAFVRPPSIAIRNAQRWATAFAQHLSPAATAIDSGLLLAGLLRDGIAALDALERAATARLVDRLGGADNVGRLLGRARMNHEQASSDVLPFAAELAPVFDRALIFAAATGAPAGNPEHAGSHCDVRHVLPALLMDVRPLPAFELLRRAGRTADGLLAQLVVPMSELAGCDPARLRAVLDELREGVVAGYDNDEARGEDRLDIGRDVRALAAVLASTQCTPPLSVGLFGDWGSGKSFFMAKLRERIDQLAHAARARPNRESWFCGQKGEVLQIEFNAWHYIDSDLWSNLAAHVFNELGRKFKAEFASACVAGIESLKERQQAIEAEQRILGERTRTLDDELAHQRTLRANRKLQLSEYITALEEDTARNIKNSPSVAALSRQLHIDGQASRAELVGLRHDLMTFTGRVMRWWQTVRSPERLLITAVTLILPLVAGGVVWELAREAWGAVTASLGSLLGWSLLVRQRAFQTLRPAAELIDDALDEVDRIEAAARGKQSAEEQRFETERDQVSARVAQLEREQLELTKRRGELDVQLAALGDASSLKDFVLSRASSNDYRKNLGIVSAVHKDFQELARLLAPGAAGPDVERIILYIDDLDRCPPPRVVEVLQAVHVLLSLPLFVVVVGVDSRWLIDSLMAYYRKQFPPEIVPNDRLKPQQYLEKIFQISFTLMPMNHMTYGSLVGAMLEGQVDAMPPVDAASDPATGAGTDDLASRRAGSGRAAPASAAGAPIARSREAEARVDLTPRSLRIEPAELTHLKQFSDLFGSPRAAKRFVNLYRMVRAMLDDEALDRLITGGYKVTQICLAVVVGSPSLGAELFEAILARQISSRSELVGWCERRGTKVDGTRERATLHHLAHWDCDVASWDIVRDSVRRVARFSFETGNMLRYHS